MKEKLLRALESGVVSPLGSTRPVQVDVRMIGASNHDLAAAVAARTFREDLYYRLHVFPIALPPLRERPEDVPALAALFRQEYGSLMDMPFSGFDAPALDALQAYRWPGNVRELRHVIERAAILCTAPTVALADLPPVVAQASPAGPRPQASARGLAEIERETILGALDDAGGNQSKAARALGITRNQIQYWLRTRGRRA